MNPGRVQWFTGKDGKGVLFATSREAAVNAAKRFGTVASPALVGSVQGETLKTMLADAFRAGADSAFVVDDTQQIWRM